jgi:hypothetical protein
MGINFMYFILLQNMWSKTIPQIARKNLMLKLNAVLFTDLRDNLTTW